MINHAKLTLAISEISAVELVQYEGRIANPRQVAIERKYSSYYVCSSETTAHGKHKSVRFHEDDNLTTEAIQAKVIALVDSAIRDSEEQAKRDEESRKRHEASKTAKEKAERAWIAKLRFAKSGQTEKPIEGTENQFRAFSARQLVGAGNGHYGIQVALPIDLDKRAEFLAKLDSFIQTL